MSVIKWSLIGPSAIGGYVDSVRTFTITETFPGKFTLAGYAHPWDLATSTSVFKLHATAQRIADGTRS